MGSQNDILDFARRLREAFLHATSDSLTAFLAGGNLLSSSAPGSSAEAVRNVQEAASLESCALELFELQFEHNLSYRRFCQARGCHPETVRNWADIPAIPATAFKELDLSCLSPLQRTRVFHSSGTTERLPSKHFHSTESLRLYEASLLRCFEAHALVDLRTDPACQRAGDSESSGEEGITVISLVPSPELAPHSSLAFMCGAIQRRFGTQASTSPSNVAADGSWELDADRAVAALSASVEQGKPVAILGTAFLFVHLLDVLASRSLRFELPPGSRIMETGGYKGRSRELPKSELHRLITEGLGIPSKHILCEYGMSELSSQAYDLVLGCDYPDPGSYHRAATPIASSPGSEAATPSRVFRFPPWARAVIVSPETGREVREGETGLIRVYDLANVFSVMAIQTEDLGIRRGDGFELIGRASLAEPRGCSLMSAAA